MNTENSSWWMIAGWVIASIHINIPYSNPIFRELLKPPTASFFHVDRWAVPIFRPNLWTILAWWFWFSQSLFPSAETFPKFPRVSHVTWGLGALAGARNWMKWRWAWRGPTGSQPLGSNARGDGVNMGCLASSPLFSRGGSASLGFSVGVVGSSTALFWGSKSLV